MKDFGQSMMGHFPPFLSHHLRLASIGLVGTMIVACSEGKVTQCNRLIEIANQAASNVEAATQNSSPEDPEAFLRVAETAEEAANQLETLEIEDETLQGFRQRFIDLYDSTSDATRALVAAVEEQNLSGAEDAYARLETATSEEEPLVQEVNTYCGGTPQ